MFVSLVDVRSLLICYLSWQLHFWPTFLILKNKSRLMGSPCCLCVYVSLPLCICDSPTNFECVNQSSWNLVRISWHLSPSQWCTWQIPPISLCVCMCIPLMVARQRLCRHVPAAMNICKNWRIIRGIIFYVFRIALKESRWLCLTRTACLLCGHENFRIIWE
jgi:hypothetical protein